ncbi:MAG: hypothetical protein Q4D62_12965, partial [Planctomycetia bacterium]|nr:hypothetical protein [Planctomycetia bacterium]
YQFAPNLLMDIYKYSMKNLAASIVFLAIFLSGCGDGRPARVPVSGVVHVDGAVVTAEEGCELFGFVRFYPVDGGRLAQARLEENGTFTLGNYERADGCPRGEFVVELSVTSRRGNSFRYRVPPRYASRETSDLRVTISDQTDSLILETHWLPEEEKERKKTYSIENDAL